MALGSGPPRVLWLSVLLVRLRAARNLSPVSATGGVSTALIGSRGVVWTRGAVGGVMSGCLLFGHCPSDGRAAVIKHPRDRVQLVEASGPEDSLGRLTHGRNCLMMPRVTQLREIQKRMFWPWPKPVGRLLLERGKWKEEGPPPPSAPPPSAPRPPLPPGPEKR